MNIRRLIVGLAIVALLSTGMTAQAAINISGWEINLTNVTGQDLIGVYDNIDTIGFTGITHTTLFDLDDSFNDPAPGAGTAITDNDEILIDGLLRATEIVSAGTPAVVSGSGMEIFNFTWEMTFDFSVAALITDASNPLMPTFSHIEAGADSTGADGFLDVYIDNILVDGSQSNSDMTLGGNNFQDGTHVARFQILNGDGGGLNFSTLGGSDDATFELVWALEGVFWAAIGGENTDLSTLTIGDTPDPVLLAVTDSNFDMDPDNDGEINSGPPSTWNFADNGVNPPFEFFASEDGSLHLEVTPEPASLLIWGLLAMLAMGVCWWKKQ